MGNTIHNLDTKFISNETGEFPAIVMGLNLLDVDQAESFLDHVTEQFKNQRMCSPPQTTNMTITLAGEMTAETFSIMWRQRATSDPILNHFMSTMVFADVFHIQGETLLDRASLISPSEDATG